MTPRGGNISGQRSCVKLLAAQFRREGLVLPTVNANLISCSSTRHRRSMLFGDVFMKQLAAIRLSDACDGFRLNRLVLMKTRNLRPDCSEMAAGDMLAISEAEETLK